MAKDNGQWSRSSKLKGHFYIFDHIAICIADMTPHPHPAHTIGQRKCQDHPRSFKVKCKNDISAWYLIFHEILIIVPLLYELVQGKKGQCYPRPKYHWLLQLLITSKDKGRSKGTPATNTKIDHINFKRKPLNLGILSVFQDIDPIRNLLHCLSDMDHYIKRSYVKVIQGQW